MPEWLGSWEYGIVGFLDILGFSALVEGDAKGEDPKNLKRLVSAMSAARADGVVAEFAPTIFSDSVILSAAMTPDAMVRLLEGVAELQRGFLRERILIRGAVAFGKHYREKDTLYSEALVRAYRIESQRARFPRVVVDADLWDWFYNHRERLESLSVRATDATLIDRDGERFINYAATAAELECHVSVLKGYFAEPGKAPGATLLEKYQWLAEYHNFIVAQGHHDHLAFDGEFLKFRKG